MFFTTFGAEGGKEHRVAGEIRKLNGGHGPAAGRIPPTPAGVSYLALCGHARNAQEIDPLDMTNNGEAHNLEPIE
jgi:hypothetical protein